MSGQPGKNGQDAFHDLPRRTAEALYRAGYTSREQVARTPDVILRQAAGIAIQGLRHIRRLIGPAEGVPWQDAQSPPSISTQHAFLTFTPRERQALSLRYDPASPKPFSRPRGMLIHLADGLGVSIATARTVLWRAEWRLLSAETALQQGQDLPESTRCLLAHYAAILPDLRTRTASSGPGRLR